jgi:hypothetical protein
MSNTISSAQNVSVRQGTTFRFTFTMTDSGSGAAIDISNSKLKITVKEKPSASTVLSLSSDSPIADPAGSHPYNPGLPPLNSTIGVTDGPGGKWTLNLTANKTRAMDAGKYQYEVDRTAADGTVDTIMAGVWAVEASLD